MKYVFCFCLIFVSFAIAVVGQSGKAAVASPPPITEITVEVEGGKTLHLKAADLAKLPRKEFKATDHDGVEATFSGYELREILAPAGAKFGKDLKGAAVGQFLVIEAADGYHAVYSITELDPDFTDKSVILADRRDGKPLDAKSGPWQVIATNEKKHSRWVRQVTKLSVQMAKVGGLNSVNSIDPKTISLDDDLIRETVFINILSQWAARNIDQLNQLKTYYIAVDVNENPSEELLKKLRKLYPAVKNDSECAIGDGGVILNVSSGEPGVRFFISKLKWLTKEKVIVSDGSQTGNMGEAECEYELNKRGDAWFIDSKMNCWIS
jgi:hypothetical protein